MEYSRFDDVVLLLFDLCKPFNDKETMKLMDIKISMANDKDFEKGYTAAVKGLYVKHFKEIQNKTYKKRRFTDINPQLIQRAGAKEAVLLPPYTKIGNQQNFAGKENLRARILKLYDKKTNS